ncbi:hypothetical protein IWQ62_005314 [Dispira parvispora]|uniref:Uncharacterized protein n=1 Tax=Dispira parvispora TaxID=1520584 RepID=A0A9W8E4M3_9FUNG|nr:hypothetical protein IWQ62_005314 [Dispira parvispora]
MVCPHILLVRECQFAYGHSSSTRAWAQDGTGLDASTDLATLTISTSSYRPSNPPLQRHGNFPGGLLPEYSPATLSYTSPSSANRFPNPHLAQSTAPTTPGVSGNSSELLLTSPSSSSFMMAASSAVLISPPFQFQAGPVFRPTSDIQLPSSPMGGVSTLSSSQPKSFSALRSPTSSERGKGGPLSPEGTPTEEMYLGGGAIHSWDPPARMGSSFSARGEDHQYRRRGGRGMDRPTRAQRTKPKRKQPVENIPQEICRLSHILRGLEIQYCHRQGYDRVSSLPPNFATAILSSQTNYSEVASGGGNLSRTLSPLLPYAGSLSTGQSPITAGNSVPTGGLPPGSGSTTQKVLATKHDPEVLTSLYKLRDFHYGVAWRYLQQRAELDYLQYCLDQRQGFQSPYTG